MSPERTAWTTFILSLLFCNPDIPQPGKRDHH
jgi:hypothetical protein